GNGLFLSATPSDLMISDCVIGNATEGIKLESAASLTLRNCTLTGAQKIRLNDDSHLFAKNSTRPGGWHGANIYFNDDLSSITTHWDVTLCTIDNETSSPLASVQVDIQDAFGTTSSLTSDGTGRLLLSLEGLFTNNTITAHYSPYNFTGSKNMYHTAHNDSVPVDGYTVVNLSLDPIKIDLFVDSSSLDPAAEAVLYGEDIKLEVTVGNSGEDNFSSGSEFFPALIYYQDKHTNMGPFIQWVIEDRDTLDFIVELNSGENVTVTDLLEDLTPGFHNISVFVDPDQLNEDLDHDNNFLLNATFFRVNVPPALNITTNLTGLLNGTLNIAGSAWDNRTDCDNITNLDLRYWLDGDEGSAVNIASLANYTHVGVNETLDWNITLDTTSWSHGDGWHNLTVEADDGNHTFNTTVAFEVKNNVVPVLSNVSWEPENGTVTTSFIISAEYSDEDDEQPVSITVNFTSAPGDVDTDPLNGTMDIENPLFPDYIAGENFIFTRTFPEKGDYTFYIAATDGKEWNFSAPEIIMVNNTPPAAQSYGADKSYIAWGETVEFNATYQDDDGEYPDTYNLTLDD
ncbi:MAG: hypothetical protein KAT70_04010, partial [Thermoplasmata archaeon]|nr:hypothetical protein [Thermoplasmata archaeon]